MVAVRRVRGDRLKLRDLDEVLFEVLDRYLGGRRIHHGLHRAAHALFKLLADRLDGFRNVQRLAVHALRKHELALVVIVRIDGRILALDLKLVAARGQLLFERRQLQRIRELVRARLLIPQDALQGAVQNIDDLDVLAQHLELLVADCKRHRQACKFFGKRVAAGGDGLFKAHTGNVHVAHQRALRVRLDRLRRRRGFRLRLNGRIPAACKAAHKQRGCKKRGKHELPPSPFLHMIPSFHEARPIAPFPSIAPAPRTRTAGSYFICMDEFIIPAGQRVVKSNFLKVP